MARIRKYSTGIAIIKIVAGVLLSLLQPAGKLQAQQEKKASIQLSFLKTDTTKTCRATVLSDNIPVKGTEVHLYVKRMYSLLPVGKVVATDEKGQADIAFPLNLPGDRNDLITVIAKIEGDDTYGNVQAQEKVKWGVLPKGDLSHLSNRSLSASRENAPMFLVVASILIIVFIWGTIFYIVFQLVRIKKSASRLNTA